MIKSELITRLTDKNPHLTQRDIERVVNVIFGEISDTLSSSGHVELRGWLLFNKTPPCTYGAQSPHGGGGLSTGKKYYRF